MSNPRPAAASRLTKKKPRRLSGGAKSGNLHQRLDVPSEALTKSFQRKSPARPADLADASARRVPIAPHCGRLTCERRDSKVKTCVVRSVEERRGSRLEAPICPPPSLEVGGLLFAGYSGPTRAIAMPNPSGTRRNFLTPAVRRAGIELRRTRANKRAAELAPIVNELQAAGVTSLKGIAAALNQRGVPTSLGHRRWYPMQVARLLRRLACADEAPDR
jgi:hypothetical protein